MNPAEKSSNFLYLCDLRDSCVNPRERKAGFLCEPRDICVNPVEKSLNFLYLCDLRYSGVNPKEW